MDLTLNTQEGQLWYRSDENFTEIFKDSHISNIEKGIDGFKAIYRTYGFTGTLICSTGAGWEHVSVSPFRNNYTPTWEDMCKIKDIFWKDDEAVIQIHPPKNQYVNNLGNCLHLWRCSYKEMLLPPSCLVGIRKGQTNAELMEEIKKAYELAGERM